MTAELIKLYHLAPPRINNPSFLLFQISQSPILVSLLLIGGIIIFCSIIHNIKIPLNKIYM